MGKKLFVGSLSWDTTDESLRQAFEGFGSVREARVIRDRATNQSRGFGFVTFNDDNEAISAIQQMNGAMLDGRSIRVNEAEERRGPGGPGGGPGGPPPRRDGPRPHGGGGGPEVHRRGGPPREGGGGRYGDGDRGGYGGGGPGGGRPEGRYGDRGGGPGGGYGGGGPGGPGGGYGGGPGRGGPPRGPRPGGPPGRGGPPGGAGGFQQPSTDSESWDDGPKRDRRATKKKKVTAREDEAQWPKTPAPKRDRRESGRTWRDYTVEEDEADAQEPQED